MTDYTFHDDLELSGVHIPTNFSLNILGVRFDC